MKNSQQGFTLIELITVIVLLGILSAFAISRFPSSQSYSTTVIKNQLIASIRLAQQTALSRASVNRLTNSALQTQLQITRDSDNWSLNITSGPINHSAQAKHGNETLHYGTNTSSSCSALTAVTASAPLTLIFDGDGNRVASTNPAAALRICINTPSSSTADVELCISPSGYVYEGICVS